MLIKTRLIKILLGFLILALFQNLGFPLAANHGRFDPSNKEFQPYLLKSLFFLIELIFIVVLISGKPMPSSGFYKLGKLMLPLIFITLTINITEMVPLYWGAVSTLLFLTQIFGIMLSLWLAIAFFRNREIQSN